MNNFIEINGRKIGDDFPPYIIAEMSANHNDGINNAYKIIDMAKACGADAVKWQTYTADTITMWYNSHRLHSYLGYKSLNQSEFEMQIPRLELKKAS